MSTPYLAEIRIISWNFAPKGWAFCNGQLLPINQNQALFSLLGTTYGGDGRVNFALPDLRGRSPVHMGNGLTLGDRIGEENHTILISEMSNHNHLISASSASPDKGVPTGNEWASLAGGYSNSSPNTSFVPSSVTNAGANQPQPHNNMQPYLVINFVIALQGIFPSQN